MTQDKQAVLVPDYLTVRELAELIEASPIDVMKQLINNGIMAAINQQIDFETAAIVIEEMGFEALSASVVAAEAEREKAAEAQTWRRLYDAEDEANLVERPPIVTILGHVDHGKTTLLDAIRSSQIAEGEAGGITQHIGAYRVRHDGRYITFLDTPGHEAFTAMRARGAQGADIAVLVVAVDDGVMPTTREAIDHARAANVPIVVALTKVDKRNANPERAKQQLAELGLVPDEWDGNTLMVPVAALEGQGLEDLLEAILLVADDNKIVANPKANPAGIVIEAEVDPSRGTIATLLVLNGTLRTGDIVVAGETYGRIKAMFDEYGKRVKEAEPSTPVAVLGLNDMPSPGDHFEKVAKERQARQLAEERRRESQDRSVSSRPGLTLEDIFAQYEAGTAKELTLIVKSDVQGTLQPVIDILQELDANNQDGIGINILSAGVGDINESDVMLASASNAIIVGFNVDVDSAARRVADSQGVDIRLYKVIYKLQEDIELALHGLLDPVYEKKVIGRAEVRQTFKIPRIGTIAGSYIRDGEARRNARARLIRDGEVIVEDVAVSSLKRFEEDVREVRSGFECGIGLQNVRDIKEGDVIEFFVSERVT
ncbi:MAG: translation initiation factor IF-2 [Chloroflexi bacterium]|nr:MAG: translation initiation factor IF-2 [Phototrophicales bacterium]RMF78139.1 MAG: translation initiation factor IF-2 [Chloroflexota bacterium]